MFFKKKPPINTIFSEHYKKIISILRSSKQHYSEFEVLPAMYVICDYAAAVSGQDRYRIATELEACFLSEFGVFRSRAYDDRIDLYGSVIRNGRVRGEWYLGNIKELDSNPVSSCIFALGDILYNPKCAENYHTAPRLLLGALDAMTFTNTVLIPIQEELVAFYNDIYRLS